MGVHEVRRFYQGSSKVLEESLHLKTMKLFKKNGYAQENNWKFNKDDSIRVILARGGGGAPL